MYGRHSFVQRRLIPAAADFIPLTITSPGGMIHYWPMDTLTTTTPDMIQGPTYDLTAVNSPVLTTGMIGNALDLEFSSTQYAAATNANQGPQSGLTICCWIRLESINSFQQVVTKKSAAGPTAAYCQFFMINSSGRAQLNGRIMQNTTTWIGRGVASPIIDVGGIFHVAMTWNGGTNSTDVKLYRNGVQVDDQTDNSGTFAAIYSGSDLKWNVGAQYDNQGTSAVSETLDGWIDDVRVYSSALSLSDIRAIFLNGNWRHA